MNAKIKLIGEKFRKLLDIIWVFLKNTGEKIQDTHPFVQIVSFLVCLGILFVIFLSIMFTPHVRRSIFFFQDAEKGSIHSEIRYLPQSRDRDGKLAQFASEVLLGPETPTLKPLFNPGTKIVDCFARKDAAYINLSSEALLPGTGVTDSKKASALFKKNVCTNFGSIDKIYLYVDGIEVYSENPYADAREKNKKR
jgi:Sporulation and spore germination.